MSPTRRSAYARARTKSNVAPLNLEFQPAQQHPFASSPSTSTSAPAKQDPMSPSSRYLHNLRVIQRHDPSITSLFDQFPHVCVYHHKGDEWQKKGCEGAMFLFERLEEPKYGFYILNRNNTGDYIQRLTPDDDVELANAYLIYRAFGKVTSDTIGLWTMVTQDREAMSQVMMRLHSYVRRGERYPDIYRRKPETWSTTPAPAHAHAQTQFVPQPQPQPQALPQTPARSYSQPYLHFPLQSSPYLHQSPAQPPPVSSSGVQADLSSSISTFSNLIAKLDNNRATKSTAHSSSPYLQTAAPHSGARTNSKAPDRTISASVPPPRSTTTGIPLLDSIFASASGATAAAAASGPVTAPPAPPPFSLANLLPPTSTLHPHMNGIAHSPSSSSGVTPTQHITELPRSMSPSKNFLPLSPMAPNGAYHGRLNPTMRGILPITPPFRRHGRESAPPERSSVLDVSNGARRIPTPRRHNSAQHPPPPPHTSIPEAKEDEEDEKGDERNHGRGHVGDVGNGNIGLMDSPVSAVSPGLNVKLTKGRKKERTREGGRVGGPPMSQQQQQQQQQQKQPQPDAQTNVEWSLVDDRSLSVDESEEGEVSGLGDGLMDAIATLSESDAYMSGAKTKAKKANGLRGVSSVNGHGAIGAVSGGREVTAAATAANPGASRSNVSNTNGRGRRKRKPRERGERDDGGLAIFSSSTASAIINGATTTANGTSAISNSLNGSRRSTPSAGGVFGNGPTPSLHNLNLNTNVSSYSYSSSTTPGFSEIARAPSSSSASSRSLPVRPHHQYHHSTASVPASSTTTTTLPNTAEIRNTLAQTYGNRCRVGDAVILSEKELKAEIVQLINNDPTFMKELYQAYLSKVKV